MKNWLKQSLAEIPEEMMSRFPKRIRADWMVKGDKVMNFQLTLLSEDDGRNLALKILARWPDLIDSKR